MVIHVPLQLPRGTFPSVCLHRRPSLLFVMFAVLLSACLCKSREEKLKEAEEEGNTLLAAKARLVKGAGEAVKKEGKEAAQAIAEGTSEVFKGLGQGFEKGLKNMKHKLHESVAANGLGITRVVRGEEGTAQHTLTAYFSFEKPFVGTLEMRAYDSEDREVGRSRIETETKEPTARYLDFTFDQRTPLLTASYVEIRASPKP